MLKPNYCFIGLGEAARLVTENIADYREHFSRMRNQLQSELQVTSMPYTYIIWSKISVELASEIVKRCQAFRLYLAKEETSGSVVLDQCTVFFFFLSMS